MYGHRPGASALREGMHLGFQWSGFGLCFLGNPAKSCRIRGVLGPGRSGTQESQEGGLPGSGCGTPWGRTLKGAILAFVRSEKRQTKWHVTQEEEEATRPSGWRESGYWRMCPESTE